MMVPIGDQIVRRQKLAVQPGNRRTFRAGRANMHDLRAEAFGLPFDPQGGGWLAQPGLRRRDGVIEHL